MSSELASLDVSVTPLDKFQEYLATKKMRLTQGRSIIVEEVFSDHEHFEADQLVARLAPRASGRNHVSRATVYRTLNQLVEAGLLRKVARPNGREVYEHDYGYPQHDHLVCEKCGTLIEFHNDAISRILEAVASEHGFRIEAHRLEVYGSCNECNRPLKPRHRKLELL